MVGETNQVKRVRYNADYKGIRGTFVANNWAIIKHMSSFGLTRFDLKVNIH